MMDLGGNCSSCRAEPSTFPALHTTPTARETGKGSVCPRACRAQTPVCACSISLPGQSGMVTPHSPGARSLENTRSPDAVRPAGPQSTSLACWKVFSAALCPAWPGDNETPTSPASSCSLPWPPSRSTSQEGRKERYQGVLMWKRLRRSHKKNKKHQEWLCSAPSVPLGQLISQKTEVVTKLYSLPSLAKPGGTSPRGS